MSINAPISVLCHRCLLPSLHCQLYPVPPAAAVQLQHLARLPAGKVERLFLHEENCCCLLVLTSEDLGLHSSCARWLAGWLAGSPACSRWLWLIRSLYHSLEKRRTYSPGMKLLTVRAQVSQTTHTCEDIHAC